MLHSPAPLEPRYLRRFVLINIVIRIRDPIVYSILIFVLRLYRIEPHHVFPLIR